MNYTVLLDSDSDTKKAEHEEKSKFIRTILETLNIDVSFWDPEHFILSVDERIRLRDHITKFDIKIIESSDGEIEIYFESKPIAKWSKPQYKLKRDYRAIDPKKKLFLEMQVNFSSVFEDD